MYHLLHRQGRSAFVTYSQEKSDEESRKARWIAEAAGLDTDGRLRHWGVGKGSVAWTSIGGPLTGKPIDDLLIIDDPIKDRREAESATMRKHVVDWFNSVAVTRMHPGASRIIVQTRWHPDDLYGTLAKRDGYEVINLPAINDQGQALWPEHRPLEFLESHRAEIGAYDWASLYQGAPRPRGGAVFGEPTWCDAAPTQMYRAAHGVDLAYTAKTYADHSVCLTMLRVERGNGDGADYYVVDVVRKQVDAPSFTLTLKAQRTKWPGRMIWHCSGTEKGAGQFVKKHVPQLELKQAKGDKFQRAQPVAAAWNAGRVHVLSGQPWSDVLVAEVCGFTGVNDTEDDQVDALSSAFDALKNMGTGGGLIRIPGRNSL